MAWVVTKGKGRGRIGAVRPELVSPEVRALLESADGETANFMEQMAIDMVRLLRNAFPDLPSRAVEFREVGLVGRMRAGALHLLDAYGLDAVHIASASPSDTVRGWGALAVGLVEGISLPERFALARRFAEDEHFAVREWAWLGVRAQIIGEPQLALRLLRDWALTGESGSRRFASEATRPRGVWSKHIPELKENPSMGMVILEPLRRDPSPNVQVSVGNWLNDAGKSRPSWVADLCTTWGSEGHPATAAICKRATRNLEPERLEIAVRTG
jgi:3-methyladenine DNA glycosylase AlkC